MEFSDEEYLFLLTKVFTFDSSYLFKHLYDNRPKLAKKSLRSCMAATRTGERSAGSYHVTFEEVFENAKEILQLKDYIMPGNPNSTMIFF